MTDADDSDFPRLAYSTAKGRAYQGDSRRIIQAKGAKAGSVDLIFTSTLR